jgi:hypothetical protein
MKKKGAMGNENIIRKNLDNQQFIQLRKNTEKIAKILDKRLKGYLNLLKPLFIPRKLLGTYIKSSSMEEISGSDKAFAELQEQYAAICEKPFGLPKKLKTPLPPISNKLDAIPFRYSLYIGDSPKKATNITAANRWILSYRSECPYNRLKAMVMGEEKRQPDDMKQSLIEHLTMVILLKHFKDLIQLFQDLRYEVVIQKLEDLGGLPVVILKASIESFLPPDDFILQITQLSGIPAFQEIIDLDAVEKMPDPFRETLQQAIS